MVLVNSPKTDLILSRHRKTFRRVRRSLNIIWKVLGLNFTVIHSETPQLNSKHFVVSVEVSGVVGFGQTRLQTLLFRHLGLALCSAVWSNAKQLWHAPGGASARGQQSPYWIYLPARSAPPGTEMCYFSLKNMLIFGEDFGVSERA